MRVLALVLLAACGVDVPRAPRVLEYGDASCLDGARAWAPLGFVVGDVPSGLPACGSDWWQIRDYDCEIVVSVVRDPLVMARSGSSAYSVIEDDAVYVDPEVVDPFALAVACAHEFGHVLLQTTTHTKTGIMSGVDDAMSADDFALACDAVGLCR